MMRMEIENEEITATEAELGMVTAYGVGGKKLNLRNEGSF